MAEASESTPHSNSDPSKPIAYFQVYSILIGPVGPIGPIYRNIGLKVLKVAIKE